MSYNVVVVDDDEIILLHNKIIQRVWPPDSPKTFNSAHKALTFFNSLSNDGESILLFLDINMPVMDGWGLLDIIHEADFDKKRDNYGYFVRGSR
jgi:CheY-like chemotaxis protein